MRGVIYFAVYNFKYVKYAKQSAESLKRHMPHVPVTLYTDLDFPSAPCFDRMVRLPPMSRQRRLKQMLAMLDTPYDPFICLDADTWVCGSLDSLFELVESPRVDLAMPVAHERPARVKLWASVYAEAKVPDIFPFFTSAVLVAQCTDRTNAFLQAWADHYNVLANSPDFDELTIFPNEPSMRAVLYHSDIRIMPLNEKYAFPRHGFLIHEAKIIHWKGGERELRAIEKRVNKHVGKARFICRGKDLGVRV